MDPSRNVAARFPDRRLAHLVLAYVALTFVGVATAFVLQRPARFDAPGNPDTILQDAVLIGTGLSAPLVAVALFVLGGWLAQRIGRPQVAGWALLLVFATLFTIGYLGEPEIQAVLAGRTLDLPVLFIATPMALVAVATWAETARRVVRHLRDRRDRRHAPKAGDAPPDRA